MNNAPKSIIADFLKSAPTTIKLMLDEQPSETLEAVQREVTAGASISIEVSYPPEGVPAVVLWLIFPDATRKAVTNVVFTHNSLQ